MKKIQSIKHKLAYIVAICVIFTQVKAQNTLTLQPGTQNGFDTPIGYYPPLNYSTMNFSFMSELVSKALNVGGSCSIARSLMRFDLSAIPVNAVIQSASLSLYYVSGVNPAHSGPNASYIRRIISGWTNTLVTWSTEPATTSAGQATLAQSTSPTQDYTIDVTGMVSYMTANPQSNFGFELGLFNETCNAILTFGSSKNSDSTKRPQLIVRYVITTGLPENRLKESISIYPNPSKGEIGIQSDFGDLKLEVYNLTSELVFKKEIRGTYEQVDLSYLSPGIYIYKIISSSGQSTTGKLIFR